MTIFIDDDGAEVEYTDPNYIKFVEEMEEAGIPWLHYRGRFYYEGPSALTSDQISEEDIIRASTGKMQKDNMGLDFVLYPKGRT